MLGMMNAPGDNIEFYSVNSRSREQLTEEDARTFTEVKPKDEVTYTEDGKRLINGKPCEKINAHELWATVIRRSSFAMAVERQENNNNNNNSEEEIKEVDESEQNEEPVSDSVRSDKEETSSSSSSSSDDNDWKNAK